MLVAGGDVVVVATVDAVTLVVVASVDAASVAVFVAAVVDAIISTVAFVVVDEATAAAGAGSVTADVSFAIGFVACWAGVGGTVAFVGATCPSVPSSPTLKLPIRLKSPCTGK